MALRTVIKKGDDTLRKRCREVTRFDERLAELAEDMIETMYDYNGIGLAASQIAILKRIFVMQVDPDENVYVCVNPEIISMEGSKVATEGCLSVPGYFGAVERPLKVHLKYQDLNGDYCELIAEDLMAACVCHEVDHLNGTLYIDKVKGHVYKETYDKHNNPTYIPVEENRIDV